jgi:undecaprenyl-diphosphatase
VKPLTPGGPTVAAVVVTATLSWSGALLLWWQADLDKWLLVSQNGLRTNALVVGVAQAATNYGMAAIVLVQLAYLMFAFKHERLRDAYRVYLLVLLSFAVAGIGGDLLKEIVNRPRPFVEYGGEIIALSHAGTPAFPSGHATKSVALVLPFLLLIPARDHWHSGVKLLLALIALAVCCSRVVLGAHYVSDVLAGIGMALTCLPLAILLSNRILGRMTRARLDFAIKVWAAVLLGLMVVLVVM